MGDGLFALSRYLPVTSLETRYGDRTAGTLVLSEFLQSLSRLLCSLSGFALGTTVLQNACIDQLRREILPALFPLGAFQDTETFATPLQCPVGLARQIVGGSENNLHPAHTGTAFAMRLPGKSERIGVALDGQIEAALQGMETR